MATLYVRRSGNDTTGDGLSAATAWATLGKALSASGIVSGDVLYVGAGVYVITTAVSVLMTSPTVETRIIGDVDGVFTGDSGPVIVTTYPAGFKTSAAVAQVLVTGGRNNLTFERICFIGGTFTSSPNAIALGLSRNTTFRQCLIAAPGQSGGRALMAQTVARGFPAGLLLDRCIIAHGTSYGVEIFAEAPLAGGLAYDIGVTIQNCQSQMLAGYLLFASVTGTLNTTFPGGGKVVGCSILSDLAARVLTAGAWNLANPMVAYGNAIPAAVGVVFMAATSGQVVEDYNLVSNFASRTNVTVGANSLTTLVRAPLIEIGQSAMLGLSARPYAMPWVAGDILTGVLGNGSEASNILGTDFVGRPRPAGGKSLLVASGAFEAHDTAEAGTAIGAGTGPMLEGPSDQEIQVSVDATSHTLGITARYDVNHGETTKPQIDLVANPSIGVTAQTLTMAAVADTNEVLTFAAFTPTARGIVTLRLRARPAAVTGRAWFDTLTVV